MTAPVPEEKLRLRGMALRNGLLVHGLTHRARRHAHGPGRRQFGHKLDLGGKAAQRVPGVRGVAKLAEAMAVILLVKRALPEARLPMQDMRTLGAMGVAALGAQAICTAALHGRAREAAVAAVSMMLRAARAAQRRASRHTTESSTSRSPPTRRTARRRTPTRSTTAAARTWWRRCSLPRRSAWPPAAPGCEGRRPRRSSGSGAPPWRSRSSPGESATRIRA